MPVKSPSHKLSNEHVLQLLMTPYTAFKELDIASLLGSAAAAKESKGCTAGSWYETTVRQRGGVCITG